MAVNNIYLKLLPMIFTLFLAGLVCFVCSILLSLGETFQIKVLYFEIQIPLSSSKSKLSREKKYLKEQESVFENDVSFYTVKKRRVIDSTINFGFFVHQKWVFTKTIVFM